MKKTQNSHSYIRNQFEPNREKLFSSESIEPDRDFELLRLQNHQSGLLVNSNALNLEAPGGKIQANASEYHEHFGEF